MPLVRHRSWLGPVAECASFCEHEAVATRVCGLVEPSTMALPRVRVGLLILLHQLFKRLGQQAEDGRLFLPIK